MKPWKDMSSIIGKKEDGEKRRLDGLLSDGFVDDWSPAVLLRALPRPVVGP